MTNELILKTLKLDLQIAVDSYDEYLTQIIQLAEAAVTNEGIILADTIEDGMLVEMYAAFLYRKRREETAAMPRPLRYALNNRLLKQKAGERDG